MSHVYVKDYKNSSASIPNYPSPDHTTPLVAIKPSLYVNIVYKYVI